MPDKCQQAFESLGEVYHLWTGENFEVIFTGEDDFKRGMNIIGICALLHPEVRMLTFELMSNHIHITAAGSSKEILSMFEDFRSSLSRAFPGKDWKNFNAGTKLLNDLNNARNVIVYDNRNGYLVSPNYSPYTYPWGANSYYFNPLLKKLVLQHATKTFVRERRDIFRSHKADTADKLLKFDDYALPLSFCDIGAGESLFMNESQYFGRISRNIETNKQIAAEIGESIYYTDDELYGAILKVSRDKFGTTQLTTLPAQAKLELAATLRYGYNASQKQICRFLKLEPSVLSAIIKF